MKKRILCVLLCLCMTLTLLPIPALAEDKAEAGVIISTEVVNGYDASDKIITIHGSGSYTIRDNPDSSSPTQLNIIGNNIYLTLDGVSDCALNISSSNADITLVGANALTGIAIASNCATTLHLSDGSAATASKSFSIWYSAVHVSNNAELTIDGSGKLTAEGWSYQGGYSHLYVHPGICVEAGGTLTVNGGEITSTNAKGYMFYETNMRYSPAIGGRYEARYGDYTGAYSDAGAIIVNGGTLIAQGKEEGIGIGGGSAPSGSLTVGENGTVIVTGSVNTEVFSNDGRLFATGDIIPVNTGSAACYTGFYAGGDISATGLDFTDKKTPAPEVKTVYIAGSGLVLWEPVSSTMTLINAEITTSNYMNICLKEAAAIVLVGTSRLINTGTSYNSSGLVAMDFLTIEGGGILEVSAYNGRLCHNSRLIFDTK